MTNKNKERVRSAAVRPEDRARFPSTSSELVNFFSGGDVATEGGSRDPSTRAALAQDDKKKKLRMVGSTMRVGGRPKVVAGVPFGSAQGRLSARARE